MLNTRNRGGDFSAPQVTGAACRRTRWGVIDGHEPVGLTGQPCLQAAWREFPYQKAAEAVEHEEEAAEAAEHDQHERRDKARGEAALARLATTTAAEAKLSMQKQHKKNKHRDKTNRGMPAGASRSDAIGAVAGS